MRFHYLSISMNKGEKKDYSAVEQLKWKSKWHTVTGATVGAWGSGRGCLHALLNAHSMGSMHAGVLACWGLGKQKRMEEPHSLHVHSLTACALHEFLFLITYNIN